MSLISTIKIVMKKYIIPYNVFLRDSYIQTLEVLFNNGSKLINKHTYS